MRVATYNVENLLSRAKAMNRETWEDGRETLEAFAALNRFLGQEAYSEADKIAMVDLMLALGLEKDDQGPFVILRRNRGKLLRRPKTGGLVIEANGRGDWIGSLDLLTVPIREEAVHNTARIMALIDPDILAVIEAESRPSLLQFNKEVLKPVTGLSFAAAMLIDGNDERGIDVGLLLKPDHTILAMRSHVDDRTAQGVPIFSRDCAMHHIRTPSGTTIWLLINHFKSKGFGSQQANDARRLAQARRVREIVDGLVADGETNIIVLGDLNDSPDRPPLQPLLAAADLKDASQHAAFADGGFAGTFGSCGPSNKIDYILLSLALFARVTAGGYERRGVWPGVRPAKWPKLAEMLQPVDSASDHAAMWVEIDL